MSTLGDELLSVGKSDTLDEGLREVRVWQLLLFFLLPLPALPASIVAAVHVYIYKSADERIPLFVLFIVLAYIFLRMLAIGCIYMYKAFAPLSVRGRCRYTPSCSQYTLISIMRYGLLIGITIGAMRIHRCRPPYGGDDPPRLVHLLRLFHKFEPSNND